MYLAIMPENNTEGMTEEEKAQYEECLAYMDTVKEKLEFTEIEEKNTTGKMPSFTTKDLQGNTVTESIFQEKDLTVVNIWGTFCGPCIEEMPELAEWSESMPSNVQIIGLVCDIEGEDDQEHKDKALQIMEKAGAGFTNIIPADGLDSLLGQVTGVPTTIFVDKDGNITGEPVIGAYVSVYKKFVEDYISGK
ncbi:MAG: TlpA family protein disulfide reductase [Lachnospiraceae bacterium]|nr:TlpA family protein disulfide reductase [Lachnospiraceae bacterium]